MNEGVGERPLLDGTVGDRRDSVKVRNVVYEFEKRNWSSWVVVLVGLRRQ